MNRTLRRPAGGSLDALPPLPGWIGVGGGVPAVSLRSTAGYRLRRLPASRVGFRTGGCRVAGPAHDAIVPPGACGERPGYAARKPGPRRGRTDGGGSHPDSRDIFASPS